MSAIAQIAIAIGAIATLVGVMALVRMAAKSIGLPAEVQRKLIHVSTGLFALLLPWLFPDRWPVYVLIGITLIVMLVLRLPAVSKGIGAALHGVERKSYGDFLLALSVGLCFILSGDDLLFYVLPIAVLTLADAAAALAGTTYGTKRFVVEDGEKSIEGSVVFFVVTLLIALICFMYLGDLPPGNTLMICLMVAAFGTLVESQSWRGFDNLFLPLGLLIFLAVHSQSSLGQLMALAAMFLFAIIGFRMFGSTVGITTHAGRVYVIAVFLILAVTEFHNAVLPILVLCAHVWARTSNPCESDYPDLDIVAALGLFSFGWLGIGIGTGWNAISFYGATSMGLALGLSLLAMRGNLMGGVICAVILFVIRAWAGSSNLEPSNWPEPLIWLSIASILLIIGAITLRPSFFEKDRVFRLTGLALALPVPVYLWNVIPKLGGQMGGIAS